MKFRSDEYKQSFRMNTFVWVKDKIKWFYIYSKINESDYEKNCRKLEGFLSAKKLAKEGNVGCIFQRFHLFTKILSWTFPIYLDIFVSQIYFFFLLTNWLFTCNIWCLSLLKRKVNLQQYHSELNQFNSRLHLLYLTYYSKLYTDIYQVYGCMGSVMYIGRESGFSTPG